MQGLLKVNWNDKSPSNLFQWQRIFAGILPLLKEHPRSSKLSVWNERCSNRTNNCLAFTNNQPSSSEMLEQLFLQSTWSEKSCQLCWIEIVWWTAYWAAWTTRMILPAANTYFYLFLLPYSCGEKISRTSWLPWKANQVIRSEIHRYFEIKQLVKKNVKWRG